MLTGLLCLLVLTGTALAMSSDNYRLDWYVLLTGGGGGATSSTNYAVNFTVGETAGGSSSSANYGVGLGYSYGTGAQHRIYLPVVLKSYQ